MQTNATSFCVSREVIAKLRAGESATIEMLAEQSVVAAPDAPRQVAFRATLEAVGRGEIDVKINGKKETVAVLRAVLKIDGGEVVLLDDARFAVGIAGATVTMAGHEGQFPVWPDGSFRLLPPVADHYGHVTFIVSHGDKTLGSVDVDLTAPGLAEIEIRVPRPITELVWIKPAEREILAALPVSPQIKRHAGRFLDAGQFIMIPSRMVEMAGFDTIACYALDPADGALTAVTEDGLHGTTTEYLVGLVREKLADVAKDKLDDKAGVSAIHMMRGAITAWWMYAGYRVGGSNHAETVLALLREVEFWEKATNIMSGMAQLNADKLYAALAKGLAGGSFPVDTNAAQAFQIGYLGSLLFLAVQLDGSD